MSSPFDVYTQLAKEQAATNWIGWDLDTFLLHYPGADNKMLAVKSLAYNIQKVCSDWQAFEQVVCAFNNMDQPSVLQVEEICYGVGQIKLIANQPVLFLGDIPNYISACAKYYEWLVLPPALSFAQELLETISGYADFTVTPEIQNRIDGCSLYDPELIQ